ncbi:MAG: biotin--[acetyl-CoA-carboxylase] ligase [Planctomycetota bacterium]
MHPADAPLELMESTDRAEGDDLLDLCGDHPEWVLGRRSLVSRATDSTNQDARGLVEARRAGPSHGTVLTTLEQRHGRGTRGRTWWSPRASSLATSVILAPDPPLRIPPIATLLAALSVLRVGEESGARLWIRWPNDVVDRSGRKVAGILAEMFRLERPVQIVGIGVNLTPGKEPPPGPLARTSTTVQEAGGRDLSRASFLVRLLRELERELLRLDESGPEAVVSEFNRHSWLAGRQVTFRRGAEERSGTFEEVTPDLDVVIREGRGNRIRWPGGQVELLNWEESGN